MVYMTTATPATMTPAEIDTELARIWSERQQAEATVAQADRDFERYTHADLEIPRRKAEIDRIAVRKSTALVQVAKAIKAAAPYEAEFRARGGWLRYFLVTNSNGHVHREMNCTTCFSTTQYAWLIDLADCNEAEMVEEWGERACTVCFPAAPTYAAYNRPARIDREAQEARQAEKAARQDATAAKAIYGPDGGPLRVPDGIGTNYRTGEPLQTYETYRTKIAARNALSRTVQSLAFYSDGPSTQYLEGIKVLKAALDAQAPEIDTAKVIASALKKAAKDGAPRVAVVAELTKEI